MDKVTGLAEEEKMTTIPPPPGAAGNADLVHARLDEVRKDPARESVTVEWRGKPRSLDVIDMPVNVLYYNPDTHRIRAQRTVDAARDAELTADPWSPESQEYLHDLLRGDPADPAREDPEFRTLKQDLQEHGQNDAGIVTPTGVLVNGNTRRAAMRELGQPNIRVGVLPGDWTWDDIGAVELTLQLRRDYRREYSFINRLLAIEEQVVLGRPVTDILKAFRIRPSTYHQARWLLAFVNEAIERSTAEGTTASLRLVDFERDQGKLEELQRAYAALDAKDHQAAELMKEARLCAIVLGHSKTDVRWIEGDFYDKYLVSKLPESLRPEPPPPAAVSVPGLSVSVPDDSDAVKTMRGLTTAVLRAKAAVSANSGADDAAAVVIESAKNAVKASIVLAGRDELLRQRQLAAPVRIVDAADLLTVATQEMVEARASAALDPEALEEALVSLRKALVRFTQQAVRSVDEPGEALTWLVEAMPPPGSTS